MGSRLQEYPTHPPTLLVQPLSDNNADVDVARFYHQASRPWRHQRAFCRRRERPHSVARSLRRRCLVGRRADPPRQDCARWRANAGRAARWQRQEKLVEERRSCGDCSQKATGAEGVATISSSRGGQMLQDPSGWDDGKCTWHTMS